MCRLAVHCRMPAAYSLPGGRERRTGQGSESAAALPPLRRAWKNMRRAKAGGAVKESNMKGDGFTLGGLLLLDKAGAVQYAYPEKTFGDHAPQAEVGRAGRGQAL